MKYLLLLLAFNIYATEAREEACLIIEQEAEFTEYMGDLELFNECVGHGLIELKD